MENNRHQKIKYCDRVYGDVVIDEPVIIEVMECDAMQRLKEIDQSGHFEPFYPGTFQSRFEHSVGVYLLLRKYGASLQEQIAGLIHDVSHSAFSHCIDYVLEGASPAEQNHQDNIFEKFVKKTAIPKILKKYGFDVDYILDDSHFPLKENNLPDLCADRIDYSLRTARVFGEINNAAKYLDRLRASGGKWYFTDRAAAKEFASLFLRLNSKYYAGLLSAVMFASVGDYLRYSLGKGYINNSDLYLTDRQVLKKIARFHRVDRHLRKLLSRMDNKAAFENSAADHDAKIVCKSRAVDPLFKSGKKLVRLSQADKQWANTLKKESRPKSYFIKFGRRWRLPAKIMKKDPFVFLFLIFALVAAAIMFWLAPRSAWNGPDKGVVLNMNTGGRPNMEDGANDSLASFSGSGEVSTVGADAKTDDISRKRSYIESLYPRLKDYENQMGFAGRRVKAIIDGTDYYFAYITEGSGVPIVSAICFRVDAESKVYFMGELKDSGISGNENYRDIDPLTCEGLD